MKKLNLISKEIAYNEATSKYQVSNPSLKLGDLIDSLPMNCVFLKGKTGCGGTTLALRSSERYLILMPYVSNVKNKELTEKGVFVYQGTFNVSAEDTYKICATYESLPMIMSKINPKLWNLVIDEYHTLWNNYGLRQDAYMFIKDNFLKFKSYCFMSATRPDNEFGILKALPEVEIEWKDEKMNIPTVYRVMSVTNFLKSQSFILENTYRENEEKCNHYIFCNSVKMIERIVNEFKLTDYKVYMSESNGNETLKRGNIKEQDFVTYNFFTSTCFESIDLFEENPKVWVIMNEKSIHTLISLNQYKQILGRFRTILPKNVTLVSEMGNIKCMVPDKEEFDLEYKDLPHIRAIAKNRKEAFKWMDFKQNYKYLYYKDGNVDINVESFFNQMKYSKVVESYKKYNFIIYIYRKGSQDKITKNVTLQDRIANIEDYPNYPYYSLIKECIDTVGLQNTLKCKSIKAIKNALIDPNLLPSHKIREKLGLSFKWYSCKDLKAKLQKVGIYGPASRIKEFYNAEELVKKIDNVTIRGFVIKG